MTENEQVLINYYNKFNEDKRLKTKHARVEYQTALYYIHKYLNNRDSTIIDVGAGTGAYSLELFDEGYDVTAVELVKHNFRRMQLKNPKLKAYQGNALDLSKFHDNSYDMALLFGPMYHLMDRKEQLKALLEAKRVVKPNGLIMISYCMNEYAIITHGFKDGFIKESLSHKECDNNYHVLSKDNDLYHYMRLEDIDELKEKAGLERINIIAQDGAAEYLKREINSMDEETFSYFMDYHLHTCERKELLGASRHVLDILVKKK